MKNEQNFKKLSTPPGGILIWLIVLNELVVFFIGFVMLVLLRKNDPQLFQTQQQFLELKTGLWLTFLLLLSGFFLAESVRDYFNGHLKKAITKHKMAIFCGLLFIIFKIIDFNHKSSLGLSLGKNTFWDYYWLMTGFHFIHIILGLVLLGNVHLKLKNRNYEDPDFAVRGSALFWHMCDIAWLFLFPLFYIGFSK